VDERRDSKSSRCVWVTEFKGSSPTILVLNAKGVFERVARIAKKSVEYI